MHKTAATRRFPRHSLDLMVAVQAGGDHTFEATIQISEGGILLDVSRQLLVGDRLEISFLNANIPSIVGEVVYRLAATSKGRLVGVRFEKPSHTFKHRLREIFP